MKVLVTQSCLTLCDPMDAACQFFLCPWNSLGKNTGVGSLSLFQGIFPIQGSNPGLPHCRRILYQLNHKGSPVPSGTHQHFLNPFILAEVSLLPLLNSCPSWNLPTLHSQMSRTSGIWERPQCFCCLSVTWFLTQSAHVAHILTL